MAARGLEDVARQLAEMLVLLGEDPQAALARIDDLYDQDIYFEDAFTRSRGKQQFLRMNRQLLALARELRVEVRDRVTGDDSIFLTWTFHYRPRVGPLLHVPGVTHARVRDGKVFEHHDYWDFAGSLAAAVPGVRALYARVLDRLQ